MRALLTAFLLFMFVAPSSGYAIAQHPSLQYNNYSTRTEVPQSPSTTTPPPGTDSPGSVPTTPPPPTEHCVLCKCLLGSGAFNFQICASNEGAAEAACEDYGYRRYEEFIETFIDGIPEYYSGYRFECDVQR
jgi:hypothetical protein